MKIAIRIIITFKSVSMCKRGKGGMGGINIAAFYVERLAGNFLQLL